MNQADVLALSAAGVPIMEQVYGGLWWCGFDYMRADDGFGKLVRTDPWLMVQWFCDDVTDAMGDL